MTKHACLFICVSLFLFIISVYWLLLYITISEILHFQRYLPLAWLCDFFCIPREATNIKSDHPLVIHQYLAVQVDNTLTGVRFMFLQFERGQQSNSSSYILGIKLTLKSNKINISVKWIISSEWSWTPKEVLLIVITLLVVSKRSHLRSFQVI